MLRPERRRPRRRRRIAFALSLAFAPLAALGLAILTAPRPAAITIAGPTVPMPVPIVVPAIVGVAPTTAGTQVVTPQALRALRISGADDLQPDAATAAAMTAPRAVASVKLCVDTAGAVAGAQLIKSSGSPAWDAEILEGMRAWRFRPFLVNGRAVPICTAFTFIYRRS